MTVEEQYQGYGVVHSDNCTLCKEIEAELGYSTEGTWEDIT